MGPLIFVHQRLHGQVLEDALLHLAQAVVVLVEDLLGLGHVELVLGDLGPGERQDPVDVVPDHRGLGAHRAHHLELLQLLAAADGGFLRHPLVADLLLELLDLVLELVAIAQLLLDRLHLLVEVVLLLRLLHLLLHAGADLALHLQDLNLPLHELEELLEPRPRRGRLQDRLLVLQLEGEVGHDGVGEPARIVDGGHAGEHLRRDALVELDVGFEGGLHLAEQRLQLHVPLHLLVELLGPDLVEPLLGDERVEPHPPLSLDQRLHRAVGELEQLDDGGERAHREEVVEGRLVGLGLLLRGQHHGLVLAHGVLEGGDGLLAADEERHDHVREDDDVPQGKERQDVDAGALLALVGPGEDGQSRPPILSFYHRRAVRTGSAPSGTGANGCSLSPRARRARRPAMPPSSASRRRCAAPERARGTRVPTPFGPRLLHLRRPDRHRPPPRLRGALRRRAAAPVRQHPHRRLHHRPGDERPARGGPRRRRRARSTPARTTWSSSPAAAPPPR